MGSSRATASVLFTDLVGSTELRMRLGERAEDLRRIHDRLLADAVEAHTGRLVVPSRCPPRLSSRLLPI